jgi:hypothetical protein
MNNKKPTDMTVEELKEMRIEFAPGVLEQLEAEMTPQELQNFMDDIKEKITSGAFFSEAEEVDMAALEEDEPDVYAQITAAIDHTIPPKILH